MSSHVSAALAAVLVSTLVAKTVLLDLLFFSFLIALHALLRSTPCLGGSHKHLHVEDADDDPAPSSSSAQQHCSSQRQQRWLGACLRVLCALALWILVLLPCLFLNALHLGLYLEAGLQFDIGTALAGLGQVRQSLGLMAEHGQAVPIVLLAQLLFVLLTVFFSSRWHRCLSSPLTSYSVCLPRVLRGPPGSYLFSSLALSVFCFLFYLMLPAPPHHPPFIQLWPCWYLSSLRPTHTAQGFLSQQKDLFDQLGHRALPQPLGWQAGTFSFPHNGVVGGPVGSPNSRSGLVRPLTIVEETETDAISQPGAQFHHKKRKARPARSTQQEQQQQQQQQGHAAAAGAVSQQQGGGPPDLSRSGGMIDNIVLVILESARYDWYPFNYSTAFAREWLTQEAMATRGTLTPFLDKWIVHEALRLPLYSAS
eukprot:g34.t1